MIALIFIDYKTSQTLVKHKETCTTKFSMVALPES